MQPLLFVSDLHLHESRPKISSIFFNFLKSDLAANSSGIYILGDLFEFWAGDDINAYPEVISALHSATENGLSIYYMRGNRDFLIGEKFARDTGCKLLEEPIHFEIDNKIVLLMHGDTLCTDDIQYQEFRKEVRSSEWQARVLSMPPDKRLKYFQSLREASQKSIQQKPSHIMDVNQCAVEDEMRKAGSHLLIHGHTHRQNIHQLTINDTSAVRIVLGDWYNNGNVLSLQSLLDYQFIELD